MQVPAVRVVRKVTLSAWTSTEREGRAMTAGKQSWILEMFLPLN